MILGSHNSWSYLTPTTWFGKLFKFVAKCQSIDIRKQHNEYNVKHYDLRIRIINGKLQLVHGFVIFDYTEKKLKEDLAYLNYKRGCTVRIIHDVRTKSQYNNSSKEDFVAYCKLFEVLYPYITFYCGENLYNRQKDYNFKYNVPLEEYYSSVANKVKVKEFRANKIWSLFPKLYTKVYNKRIIDYFKDSKVNLMIDFICYV